MTGLVDRARRLSTCTVLMIIVLFLQNVSFQAVLLTDGSRSYVTYLYDVIHPEAPFLTGFNAGNRQGGVVVAGSEPHFNQELQTMSFRTDGTYVLYREAVLYSEVE